MIYDIINDNIIIFNLLKKFLDNEENVFKNDIVDFFLTYGLELN